MNNISQVLHQSYLQLPEQAAVRLLYSRQPEEVMTFRGLFEDAACYAHALQHAGVQPGDVVILIQQHGKELVSAFFGAVLRGAIPSIMPFLTEKLLPDQYRKSLAALFEITAPAAVITYSEFMEEVRKASSDTSVRCVLDEGQINTENFSIDWDVLTGLESAGNDIVLLQHSSGTTGLQKGVALTHQAVFNQLESYAQALKLAPDDVVVSWLPLYHDMGLIAGFLLPILRRAPLVLLSPFEWVRAPHRLMHAISQYAGTLCWLPNFAYNFCAQKIRDRDLEGIDLSSLRAVINCSEPMHWNSHAMFLDRFKPYGLKPSALATSYAMAENVFAVTQGGILEPVRIDIIDQNMLQTQQIAQTAGDEVQAECPATVKMLSAGRPINGTRLRVLDAQGRDLLERHIGEIALQSNCMLAGYFNRPDLTSKAFLDGWYLTGDLGYLVDGELFVTGRKKDLIIVGGKNIYPQDLERVAGEVEGVHPGRVVAFGVFNEETGTEDVVIIAEGEFEGISQSPHPGSEGLREGERLANEIRQRVTRGSDIALRHVYVMERNWLVKTSSGKISRSANREKYQALKETLS